MFHDGFLCVACKLCMGEVLSSPYLYSHLQYDVCLGDAALSDVLGVRGVGGVLHAEVTQAVHRDLAITTSTHSDSYSTRGRQVLPAELRG